MINLQNERIVIPYLDLKKLYRLSKVPHTTYQDLNISKKTFMKYIRFRDIIFGGIIKAESFTDFISRLREEIKTKFLSNKDLQNLKNNIYNPKIIKDLIEKKGRKISYSSSKALLSLLKKIYLIDRISVINFINNDTEDERNKNIILNYIMRITRHLSVKEIKIKFWNHPRKNKINDYLLELWLEKKIDIIGLDLTRDICQQYGFNEIPPDYLDQFESLERYRIRETGELKAKVIMKNNYRIDLII